MTPVTVSGQPAASTAVRAMSSVRSPTWDTQPQTTLSTAAGSIPLRLATDLSTWADSSTECTPDNPPFRLPTGVRTASTMTVFPHVDSLRLGSFTRAIDHNPNDYR